MSTQQNRHGDGHGLPGSSRGLHLLETAPGLLKVGVSVVSDVEGAGVAVLVPVAVAHLDDRTAVNRAGVEVSPLAVHVTEHVVAGALPLHPAEVAAVRAAVLEDGQRFAQLLQPANHRHGGQSLQQLGRVAPLVQPVAAELRLEAVLLPVGIGGNQTAELLVGQVLDSFQGSIPARLEEVEVGQAQLVLHQQLGSEPVEPVVRGGDLGGHDNSHLQAVNPSILGRVVTTSKWQ